MPHYDYVCSSCGDMHEQYHRMHEAPEPCPMCRSTNIVKSYGSGVSVINAKDGWQDENQGRGRYIGQLADRADRKEAFAYCRTRQEAVDKAKAKGFPAQNILIT